MNADSQTPAANIKPKLTDTQRDQKLAELGQVFSPSAPIVSRNLFFGRMKQLKQVVDAINERGQHGILYGERGVGKTSMANIMAEVITGVLATKATCNRTESFRDIWEKAFRGIYFVAQKQGIGFTAKGSTEQVPFDSILPSREKKAMIDSGDILSVVSLISKPTLIILDEFDSVTNVDTRIRFADTIKALSDTAPHVTLMIVGIASSVTDLIGDHRSIERCLRQIKLQRMSPEELGEIIDKGLERLGMTINPDVRTDIIRFSQGFPHYTHLLSKYAAKITLQSNDTDIDRADIDEALAEAVENVHESVRDSYQKAVMTARTSKTFETTLFACALTLEDEHGTFRASDLIGPMNKLTGKDMKLQAFIQHLGKLCQEDRGAVLQKLGTDKRHRYRFSNPLLKAFVTIKAYQKGFRGS